MVLNIYRLLFRITYIKLIRIFISKLEEEKSYIYTSYKYF